MREAKRIRIYRAPGIEYNMSKLERYIFGQAGPSIFTYLATHTIQEFLDEVKAKEQQLNPKQKDLIEQNSDNKSDGWQYDLDWTKLSERSQALDRREESLWRREHVANKIFDIAGWKYFEPETEKSVKESNSYEKQQRLYPGGAADRDGDHPDPGGNRDS